MPNRFFVRRKQLVWTILGLLTLLLSWLLKHSPSMAESLFGKVLFVFIRWVTAHSTAYLPIPVTSLLFVLLVFIIWRTIIVPVRSHRWTLRSLIGGILSTVGAMIFLFQFLWGFNYARPRWDKRLGIEISGMTKEQLTEEFYRTTGELENAIVGLDDLHRLDTFTNKEFEMEVEPDLRSVLKKNGFPLVQRPRVRIVHPKGILMRWNTAGIYLPYSGEGHVDAGLLPVQIPFTLAHEMAHGFGVTDEGDCNFLAYLACAASQDPDIRFAGIFTYWRYVAGEYRYAFPEDYEVEYEKLPELVRDLLRRIHDNDARYPDLFPKLRNTVYDTYLKSQGVSDGLHSYSRVVQLVWAYREKQEGDFIPQKN